MDDLDIRRPKDLPAMNGTMYAKVWTYLGAATSLTALSIFVQSQGGLLFSAGYLIEKRPVIACYYGAILVSFLTAAVCWAGAGYARLAIDDRPWPLRVPVVGYDGKEPIDGRAWSARIYQLFFIAAFVLIPASALIHFNRKVWGEGIIWSDAPQASENAVPVKCAVVGGGKCAGRWAILQNGGPDNRFWLTETVHDPKYFQAQRGHKAVPPDPSVDYQMHDLSGECRRDSEMCRGVQWGRVLSPTLLFGSTLFALLWVGIFSWSLCRPPRPPRPTRSAAA